MIYLAVAILHYNFRREKVFSLFLLRKRDTTEGKDSSDPTHSQEPLAMPPGAPSVFHVPWLVWHPRIQAAFTQEAARCGSCGSAAMAIAQGVRCLWLSPGRDNSEIERGSRRSLRWLGVGNTLTKRSALYRISKKKMVPMIFLGGRGEERWAEARRITVVMSRQQLWIRAGPQTSLHSWQWQKKRTEGSPILWLPECLRPDEGAQGHLRQACATGAQSSCCVRPVMKLPWFATFQVSPFHSSSRILLGFLM